jgi:hypothetical protein
MSLSIHDLPADILASYEANARARGVSLDSFLRDHLIRSAPPSPRQEMSPEEWEKALDECFDSVGEVGPLPDEAFERSSWYR